MPSSSLTYLAYVLQAVALRVLKDSRTRGFSLLEEDAQRLMAAVANIMTHNAEPAMAGEVCSCALLLWEEGSLQDAESQGTSENRDRRDAWRSLHEPRAGHVHMRAVLHAMEAATRTVSKGLRVDSINDPSFPKPSSPSA